MMCGGCWGGLRGVGYLLGFDPLRAYLKSFVPVPSSHWVQCTLIRCAGTLYPRMQLLVARIKVIAILLLTYPHVLE